MKITVQKFQDSIVVVDTCPVGNSLCKKAPETILDAAVAEAKNRAELEVWGLETIKNPHIHKILFPEDLFKVQQDLIRTVMRYSPLYVLAGVDTALRKMLDHWDRVVLHPEGLDPELEELDLAALQIITLLKDDLPLLESLSDLPKYIMMYREHYNTHLASVGG